MPEKPVKREDVAVLAAIKLAQAKHPRGVIPVDLFNQEKISKGHLKKLVRLGWLRSTYIGVGKNGGRKLAFFVNPELRIGA
jgi:hypothetical protein